MAEYDDRTRSALRRVVWAEIALLGGLPAFGAGILLRTALADGFTPGAILGIASCAFVAILPWAFGAFVMPRLSIAAAAPSDATFLNALPWIGLAVLATLFALGAVGVPSDAGMLVRALIAAAGLAPLAIWTALRLGGKGSR